jgi:O-antigen ligase
LLTSTKDNLPETGPVNSLKIKHECRSNLIGRAVFLSLLSLIVLTAIPYGTVEAWWVALFECLVFTLTAVWIVDEALLSMRRFQNASLLLPFFSLSLYAYLQTLPLFSSRVQSNLLSGVVWASASADPYQTRLFALKFLALTLTLILFARYTSSLRRLYVLIWVIIAVSVMSALFGMVRQTTQHGASGFVLPYLRTGYGQFINKNHFAFLMEMGLGLTLGIVAGGGAARAQKLVYLALALPLWTALVLSNSRGGLFAMLAQALFLGLLVVTLRHASEREDRGVKYSATLVGLFGRSLLLKAILLACLAMMLFVGAIWMGGEPLVTNLENVSGELSTPGLNETDGASRKAIWHATWQLIKDHPIAGVGFGGYWAAIPQYHRASGQVTPQEAHNDYLELMASGGLIGVALLGWFIIIFIRRVRARLRTAEGFSRAASMGALVGLFGVAVHSFVDFGLHIMINALVCILLLVIATGEVGEKGIESPDLNVRS